MKFHLLRLPSHQRLHGLQICNFISSHIIPNIFCQNMFFDRDKVRKHLVVDCRIQNFFFFHLFVQFFDLGNFAAWNDDTDRVFVRWRVKSDTRQFFVKFLGNFFGQRRVFGLGQHSRYESQSLRVGSDLNLRWIFCEISLKFLTSFLVISSKIVETFAKFSFLANISMNSLYCVNWNFCEFSDPSTDYNSPLSRPRPRPYRPKFFLNFLGRFFSPQSQTSAWTLMGLTEISLNCLPEFSYIFVFIFFRKRTNKLNWEIFNSKTTRNLLKNEIQKNYEIFLKNRVVTKCIFVLLQNVLQLKHACVRQSRMYKNS